MKKKALVVFVTILVLLPFLEGLFSISSIWRSSANENSASEELIQNDYLKLVQSLRETEDGAFIDLIFDKKEAEADTVLKLHVMDEDGNKVAIQDEKNQFEAGEDDWEVLKETKRAVDGTVSIPLPKDTQYTLYASLLELTEGEDGEVVERELLSKDELKGKPLIIAESAAPLDTTDRSNNDPLTLVAIDGFKVTFESTSKDQGQKADWKITFDKNLAKEQNYKIRYSFYDPQNPVSRNEDGSTSRFKSMQINGRNYREEETAGRSNKFTLAFHTNATYMKAEIGLVDEDGNYIQLFNADKVDMVDKAAAEAARKKAEEEAAAKKAAEELAAKNGGASSRLFSTFGGTFGGVGLQATTSPDGLPYAKTVYDDEPSARLTTLRAAGLFHVFAKEIELGQHLNGNFASPIVNVGTNTGAGSANELFYAGQISSEFQGISKSSNSQPGKFVIGSEITYRKNGNEIYLNDKKREIKNNITIERESTTTPYINFDEEFAYLENLNKDMATWEPDIVVNRDLFKDSNGQINAQTIDLREEPYKDMESIVIKIDPTAQGVGRQLTIIGLEPDHSGKVRNIYFNVEIPDNTANFDYNLEIKLKDSSGRDIPTGEHTQFSKSPILYNFYSAGSDSLYEGRIDIRQIIQGAVLAPRATGKAHTTVEGNLIFKKWLGGVETHKWDYKPKGSVTLIKQDPVENEFLGGAEFDLYVIEYDNGGNENHVRINPENEPYVTDSNGRLTVSGLSQGYQYYFIEVKPPMGSDGNPYPAYTDRIYFTVIPGTTTTTTYHPVYNVKVQEEFKFGAKKLLKDTVDKDTSFLFEVKKIVNDKPTDTVAYGKVTYTKGDAVDTEKVVKFYRSAGDRDSGDNEIGDDDWVTVLENGATYQLLETSTNGYNVKYSGYGGEGNNKFTANFTKGQTVHINFLVTNYEDEFTVKGQKEVSEKVTEDKVFKFEIKEQGTNNILAYGKSEVKSGSQDAPIEFYKDAGYTIKISGNDWFGIVNPDKTYIIEETDAHRCPRIPSCLYGEW